MPLDVLGRTRATLIHATSHLIRQEMGNLFNVYRAWDRFLQFWILNEELLVSASHYFALITSLSFVHTARRSYRLSDSANASDWSIWYRKVV